LCQARRLGSHRAESGEVSGFAVARMG